VLRIPAYTGTPPLVLRCSNGRGLYHSSLWLSRPEYGNVAAQRKLNRNRVVSAICVVVLRKPQTKPSCVDPYNRVQPRVELGIAFKHVHPDRILTNDMTAGEGGLHSEAEEPPRPGRVRE